MVSGSERVQGRLSAATRGRVTGWAWDPDIDGRLEIGVLVDGEHVETARAVIFRESLRRAGIGDGAHAFAIELPRRLRDTPRHKVVALTLPAGATLEPDAGFVGESPPGDPWYGTIFTPELDSQESESDPSRRVAAIVASSDRTEPHGMLETVVDGRVFGWAYDPRSPLQRLTLEVIVDGETVAETVAELLRPSLVAEGIGDGRHGFVVELPDRLSDDFPHAISIRLSSGETLDVAQTLANGFEWPRPPSVDSNSNGAVRMRRLLPSDDFILPRRTKLAGFTAGEGPETIVLGAEMAIDVGHLPFVVQPGVANPLAERGKRKDAVASYLVPPPRASRLPGAIVDTSSFLIMPNEHRYLSESVRHPGTLARWGYELLEDGILEQELNDASERDERVVVLGAQSNGNYSHWLIESVARALLFKPVDDGTWLYLTPPLTDWQREILDLIGVGAERILELEPQGPVRFREVISVSRGMGGLPALRPAGVVALAALAPCKLERRRIYCSRAAAGHRHVTNELEMTELLERHGFESVCPERLSVKGQIELFASAEAVFALHGSGLTNIVFSPPGTRVIELQPEEFNRGGIIWNWLLASLRDQPFVQVVCPLADTLHDLPHARRDVTVDIPHLDALLYRVLD